MSLQSIDKDSFVTETIVMFTKLGDYLLTVESSLEPPTQKLREGHEPILSVFGNHDALLAFRSSCAAFAFDFSRTYPAKVPLALNPDARTPLFLAGSTVSLLPDGQRGCE